MKSSRHRFASHLYEKNKKSKKKRMSALKKSKKLLRSGQSASTLDNPWKERSMKA